MIIRLKPEDAERIRKQAETTYPYECCGILLGRPGGSEKSVALLVELANERTDSAHNRFLITPETLLKAERDARSRDLEILGFYHSHPDAPARPSEFDREHAWPTYSYIIVSVVGGSADELNSWLLSEDRTCFDPETVSVALEVDK